MQITEIFAIKSILFINIFYINYHKKIKTHFIFIKNNLFLK